MRNERVFRRIAPAGRADFEHFFNSGLYDELVAQKRIAPVLDRAAAAAVEAGEWVVEVARLPLMVWPWEWSFSAWRDAAECLLEIQLAALRHGMILKDASAFNFGLYEGRMVLFDLQSLTVWDGKTPWHGYRQFCMHFLAPLALISRRDWRFGLMFSEFIDGIPLDFAAKLLPWRCRLQFGLLFHLYLHARLETHCAVTSRGGDKARTVRTTPEIQQELASSLLRTVRSLKRPQCHSEWEKYYGDTNYTDAGWLFKAKIIDTLCQTFHPEKVCDLGANDGRLTRLMARGARVAIAVDCDPAAIDSGYCRMRERGETNLFFIRQDLTNPTGGSGWHNREREDFVARVRGDMVFALALIHHLCIGKNVPLEYVAGFLSDIAPIAVVEFVPKSDDQLQRLLRSRDDIFDDYTEEHFREAFAAFYPECDVVPLPESERKIYVFKRIHCGFSPLTEVMGGIF